MENLSPSSLLSALQTTDYHNRNRNGCRGKGANSKQQTSVVSCYPNLLPSCSLANVLDFYSFCESTSSSLSEEVVSESRA